MTGSPSDMCKFGYQTVLLARMGARPLRFSGALLVEGCSYASRAHQERSNNPHCCVKVYECSGGFVAQIMLKQSADRQPVYFVKTDETPSVLRHWLENFDPAQGIDVSDINGRIDACLAPTEQDLSHAAKTIDERLKRLRKAYRHAASNALGLPSDSVAVAA